MEKVINLGIPHVSEQIFESLETQELIKCLKVSETWKILAGNVLLKRWKGKMDGKMLEACKNGVTEVVQLLLERCSSEDSGLNIRDDYYRFTTFMVAYKNVTIDSQHLWLHTKMDKKMLCNYS